MPIYGLTLIRASTSLRASMAVAKLPCSRRFARHWLDSAIFCPVRGFTTGHWMIPARFVWWLRRYTGVIGLKPNTRSELPWKRQHLPVGAIGPCRKPVSQLLRNLPDKHPAKYGKQKTKNSQQSPCPCWLFIVLIVAGIRPRPMKCRRPLPAMPAPTGMSVGGMRRWMPMPCNPG